MSENSYDIMELLQKSQKILTSHGLDAIFWIVSHPKVHDFLFGKQMLNEQEYRKVISELLDSKFYELAALTAYRYMDKENENAGRVCFS